MKVLQRYFAVSIAQAVAFVLVAFLALSAFMDLTGELPSVGKEGYAIQHAFLYVLLRVPFHVYEVMPVATLIGTIYTMAQFASTSEFTIMRASSMSTQMAAWMLFKIGFVFVIITFVFGELIAPRTAPLAEKLKLSARGATVSQEFRSGMWTKDIVRTEGTKGIVTGSRFFNVRQFRTDGQMLDVRLYEFDTNFRMRSLITAARAVFTGNSTWRLEDVTETRFTNTRELLPPGGTPVATIAAGASAPGTFGQETSMVATRKLPSMELVSEITPKIISVSASDPVRMSATELAIYTRHLSENKQETERFKIAFWKKLFGPLAIFVLMALALPFAYLHTRSGGVSLKIFVGIMIGVGFILVNNLFAHVGLLSAMPAILVAIAPSLLFLLLALGALWWVERH
ncbi:LPS export ABC transporter permease LptG [Massilia pseudoviolaceinigra]|uniref:LPS export ABC transporter permease LptG n=1 Tax=Massilia pseudoviolaceinigra TaxID=3057165 RepID=UPI0027968761|nr:LPS export ABC transporter permease LptG [Massilia sp. CCM 9206]MDQ1919559.1 LPS export ABC transporter permease LptG [Massilia sp. CCM 9206]